VAKTAKPLPAIAWLEPRLRLSRTISLFSFCALAVLLVVWNLAFADLHGARTEVIMAIELAPLLLLAPGLLLGHARTYAWTCFVVNLYFIKGVLAAFDPARSLLGWIEVLLSVSLFCAALLYTRWRFQYNRIQAGEC